MSFYKMYCMFYVNNEPEGKFLYVETVKLYCTVPECAQSRACLPLSRWAVTMSASLEDAQGPCRSHKLWFHSLTSDTWGGAHFGVPTCRQLSGTELSLHVFFASVAPWQTGLAIPATSRLVPDSVCVCVCVCVCLCWCVHLEVTLCS